MSVEPIPCANAAELLEMIRPSSSRFRPRGEHRDSWVFRGHHKACWQLLPRMHRPDAEHLKWPSYVKCKAAIEEAVKKQARRVQPDSVEFVRTVDCFTAIQFEHLAVGAFCEVIDELGWPYPEKDKPNVPSTVELIQNTQNLASFKPGAATALAQHHRVPTRLLDFTRRPLVAAYFAAGADRPDGREGDGEDGGCKLAVWAVNWRWLTKDNRINVIKAPRSSNSYLHAQDGVFLWDSESDTQFISTGRRRPMDELMEGVPAEKGGQVAYKFELPRTARSDLIELLDLEGVSTAHLMPSLDNAARTATERMNRRESK